MNFRLKKSNIIIILVCIVLIVIASLLYNYRNNSNNDNNDYVDNSNKIKLLKDYNKFFTINSCIYKFVVYNQSNDINNLLKVLDSEYIINNNIDSNNVFNNIEKLNGNYSFSSKKIYFEEISTDYVKYYVYGYLVEDKINSLGVKTEKYYIVYLDTNNKLFSISPYDGKVFKGDIDG